MMSGVSKSLITTSIYLMTIYIIVEPDDVYTPKEHTAEELDALHIPLDRRDETCKNYYAEFKKCI